MLSTIARFFRRFRISDFVYKLDEEEMIKLYAALLLSDNSKLTRREALEAARFKNEKGKMFIDLRVKLQNTINYGPRS